MTVDTAAAPPGQFMGDRDNDRATSRSPDATRPDPVTPGLRAREGLPAAAAVIVAGHITVPLLRAPAGAWGLRIIAADVAVDTGRLVLFAALPLSNQPDARIHDGDVVVRLLADPVVPDESRMVVDVEVLLARDGAWSRVGAWTGLDSDWPHHIATIVARSMGCDPSPIPGTALTPRGRTGVLGPLVSAGLLHDGEMLLCERPASAARFEAHVADGGILLPDGRWFARPSGALTALGFPHQNGWHYWARARDGVPLSRLRAPLPPGKVRSRVQEVPLTAMLASGVLKAGEELRFARPRKGVVHTAQVLADGQLRLADGRCYRTPAAAIAAAAGHTTTDGWRLWRCASDNRALMDLREDHLRLGS